MARELFENADTLAKERELGQIVEARWHCHLQKVPIKYHVDCLAMRDEDPIAWVELRCRSNSMLKYDTLMISLAKLQAAKRLQDDTGYPVFLVVGWSDKVGYVNLGQTNFNLGFGGRNDMRDWQDKEPVAYIALEQFQELKERPK